VKSECLSVNLKKLSDSPSHVGLAGKLANQKAALNLSGITSLSDAAADALSRQRWRDRGPWGDLNLDGFA